MKKIILLTLAIFGSICSFSQLGTDLWFAPPNVTDYHAPPNFPLYLMVTASTLPATVTINQPANAGFVPIVLNLLANQSSRVDLTAFRSQLETTPTNSVLNTGLRIQATNPVSGYYEVSNTNNNEIFALKGPNGLGTEFYIPMHKDGNFYNHHFANVPLDYAIASFDIVATQNATTVTIYSPVPVDGHAANTQFSITLNAGQTYSCGTSALTPAQPAPINNYYENPIYHPAGAIVLSDKPIAITVKDDSDHDVTGGGCYDLIGDQIVPDDIVGTEYVAVKGSLSNVGRESVIITATQNNTKVYLDGNVTPYATLFAGETYQIIIDSLSASINNAIYIQLSKPAYATHITGYGCELGSAILPPMNCAGSRRVSFVRSSAEEFDITLLVHTTAINNFTMTGYLAPVLNPANFKIVPGTGGIWSAAKYVYPAQPPTVDSTYTISNSTDLFAMGMINGGAGTGCRYGYFSEFAAKIIVNAGPDQTICGNTTAVLDGSVTGGALTGIWSTNGSGTFSPDNITLNATYIPSSADTALPSVTLTLTSTSDCSPVSDDMILTFTDAPYVNAGPDQSVCRNNPNVNLNGTVVIATGGIWSGGAGTFSPDNITLNAVYTPTAGELTAGTVTLTLTSTGNGTCNPVTDNITITFTDPPTANAGPDFNVCANNPAATLSGSVTIATGGIWSGGSGTYNPNNITLNAVYTPSAAEIVAGTVTLTLTTTGNGLCTAVSDQVTITITPAPTANAGLDQTKCANNAVTTLAGSYTVATGGIWSGGLGNYNPDNTTMNATYTPTAGEITAGTVTLILTTTGNGTCNAVSDQMVITIGPAPTANAGPDQSVCKNNAATTLSGSYTGATGGIWSGGTGTYAPGNTTMGAVYTPSAAEITAGTVTLTLTTTGNGLCNAVTDQMTITLTAAPTANAGPDVTVCGNNPAVSLNGAVTIATGGTWTGGTGIFVPDNNTLSNC